MSALVAVLSVVVLLASTYALTRWVPRHPRWRPALILLNLIVTVRYLYWRATDTLNWQGGWGTVASLVVYAAELYGFLVVLHHYVIATRTIDRTSIPPDREFSPSVDLFIATYNESLDILTRTIVGAQAIAYSNLRIHVLDDGRRAPVAALCRELGVHYITRDSNAGAKAGNINNALAQTTADYVATFDADHVPVSTFLAETLGFFRDSRVAQVQTAHHFYNPDLFQDRLKSQTYIANEQDMFFHIVQPGRDVYNSSFYCGSGAVFRRSALDEIGGLPMTTVTEDLHTSLLLHSRGWQTVYVNKNLSAGLSPESFEAYVTQRRRWARGTFQVILRQGGLFLPGFTTWQRINYFATLWYWLYGFPRVVYLIAPVLYLLLGLEPLLIRHTSDLLFFYLPHLAFSVSVFQLVNKQMRHIFWSDIYESSISVPIAATLLSFPFNGRKVHFAVTPKGKAAASGARSTWQIGLPLWVLASLLLLALMKGAFELATGPTANDAALINEFWGVYNLVILAFALLLLRQTPQRREAVRLPRQHQCRLGWPGYHLDEVTVDLSETGVSVVLVQPHLLPETMDVALASRDGRRLALKGRLVRCDVNEAGKIVAAITFLDRTPAQHRTLIEMMYSDAAYWDHAPQRAMTALEHVTRVVGSLLALARPTASIQRRSPRFACDLPGRVFDGSGVERSVRVTDIGFTGLAVRLSGGDLPMGARTRVTVEWTDRERSLLPAEVVSVRTGSMGQSIVGLRLLPLNATQSNDLVVHLLGRGAIYEERKAS
jgi:cellulose synthase (UDP-forming)